MLDYKVDGTFRNVLLPPHFRFFFSSVFDGFKAQPPRRECIGLKVYPNTKYIRTRSVVGGGAGLLRGRGAGGVKGTAGLGEAENFVCV